MKFHYAETVALIFVFVSSCTQAKIVASSIPVSGTPSPLIVTPTTLSPSQTAPSPLDTPYYDRQYKLVNTCNDTTCLFFDNVNQPPYPIGYAMITGHYLKVERTRNGETETCDGFILDTAPSELLSAYENYFMNDTAVYSKTPDGKSVINIPLWNEDEATKQIIFSSSSEKPITLRILNEPPINYGAVSCFSPLSILDTSKPLSVSDLSQIYTITEADKGKVFTYTITTRFTLALDDIKYPSSKTICVPEMIFGAIAGTSSYEIYKTGKCQLQNGDFQVTIIGVPLP
jgi:hypothetical protein